MKYIFISHLTAFKVYRAFRAGVLSPKLSKSNISMSSSTRYNKETFKVITDFFWGINLEKVDVMCANKNYCYASKHFVFHNYIGKLPNGSFVKFGDGLYVSSPELLFCQMSQFISKEKLLLLGLEMCGSYCISHDTEFGFINNLEPLTTPAKINNYICSLKKLQKNFRSINKALYISKYLEQGSASPQESRLYIMLAAPRKIGGYGIKHLRFNNTVNLSKQAKEICGQSIVIPDLSIRENKIAVEYDSDAFHNETFQNRKDKKRIGALSHDGWRTYNFVSDQVRNFQAVNNLAVDILRYNNQCFRVRRKGYDESHLNLWDFLFFNS